jgi:hypothetical protein
MTRQALARAVEIFDSLRIRVGSAAAMEQAIEYVTAKPHGPERLGIIRDAEWSGSFATITRVLDAVAQAYGVTVKQLRRKGVRVSQIRDEVVYVTRQLSPAASYPVLGRMLNRDHSSVLRGVRQFEARLAGDELLALRVGRLVESARAEVASVEMAVA